MMCLGWDGSSTIAQDRHKVNWYALFGDKQSECSIE